MPLNDLNNALKKKCQTNGSPELNVKEIVTQTYDCVKDLINITQFKDEVEKARPTGDVDEVFAKYCMKNRAFKTCLNNFSNTIEPCLDKQEKENKKVVQKIIEKILEFVCDKEGAHLAS